MTETEFPEFVRMVKTAFMAPDDPVDFILEFWQPNVMRYDLDVLKRAITSTIKDQRTITTPIRSRLPIITDYADEYQLTKTRAVEAKQRREQAADWQRQCESERAAGIKPPSMTDLAKLKKP